MSVPMPSIEPGRRALKHLDVVLAGRSEKNGPELSATMRCLAEFRDGVVGARRAQNDHPSRLLLEPVNAIISSVLAAQYPLGEIEWAEVVKARDWLSGLVDSGYLSTLDLSA